MNLKAVLKIYHPVNSTVAQRVMFSIFCYIFFILYIQFFDCVISLNSLYTFSFQYAHNMNPVKYEKIFSYLHYSGIWVKEGDFYWFLSLVRHLLLCDF